MHRVLLPVSGRLLVVSARRFIAEGRLGEPLGSEYVHRAGKVSSLPTL